MKTSTKISFIITLVAVLVLGFKGLDTAKEMFESNKCSKRIVRQTFPNGVTTEIEIFEDATCLVNKEEPQSLNFSLVSDVYAQVKIPEQVIICIVKGKVISVKDVDPLTIQGNGCEQISIMSKTRYCSKVDPYYCK